MKMKYTRDTTQACELVEAMYKGQINPCMVHATMHGNILYITLLDETLIRERLTPIKFTRKQQYIFT